MERRATQYTPWESALRPLPRGQTSQDWFTSQLQRWRLPANCRDGPFGKFFEIEDAFFYRRMHEEASSAMKNSADVMAFYDPKKREKIFLYNFVHLGANLKSITRAPIPFSEKLKTYSFELRRLIWSRKAFAGELTGAVGQAARKITKS